MEWGLVACTDIDDLMKTRDIHHIYRDWPLFIDSSIESQSSSPSQWQHPTFFPVGHSVHSKESYENMKILIDAIN
jgi:hypothetical protein